jgi:replicative DNA helicase
MTQFSNKTAEESLLGSILLDKRIILDAIEILSPFDFFSAKNQKIFGTMVEMSAEGKEIDLITLSAELEKKNILDKIGSVAHLTELLTVVPSSSHWREYADSVSRESKRRKIFNFTKKIDLLTRSNEDPEKILSEISHFSTSGDFVEASEMRSIYEIAFSQLPIVCEIQDGTREVVGVKSGIEKIDTAISAFQNSDLIIFAGRPGTGKSAVAASIALSVARQGNAVGIFSLEMSGEQIATRILAQIGRINSWQIGKVKMSEQEFESYARAVNLAPKNIHIDETAGLDIDILRVRSHRMIRKYGVKIIIVDYLQLLRSSKSKKQIRGGFRCRAKTQKSCERA